VGASQLRREQSGLVESWDEQKSLPSDLPLYIVDSRAKKLTPHSELLLAGFFKAA